MPHVLISTLEGAEADADAEQTLAAPRRAGDDRHLAHRLTLAAVHCHLQLPVHARLQQLLQRVVVLVL